MRTYSRLRLILAVLVYGFALLAAEASDVKSHAVQCGNIQQAYLSFTPSPKKVSDRETFPVVVLLHGAGDRPDNMVDAWKIFAEKKHIVLLAPELPRVKSYEEFAPRVFRCVVEDAKLSLPVDPLRVYLFGNSMGGYLAYDAAMLESRYFAAVAVHAMRIAEDYEWIVGRAERKTPIAIYVGDRDQFFTVESVRRTRDLLLHAGFDLHYVEMINHDHNYYARSGEINADAWNFLSKVRLPSQP